MEKIKTLPRKRKTYLFEKIPVIDIGAKGKAVAKTPDGRVVFLTEAVPGDIVDVQTGKKRKAYFEGKVVNYRQYSTDRVQPVCKHFDDCGGCKWQHMHYEAQLKYKEQSVLQNLKKIGHLTWEEKIPIVACQQPFFYRNKMEFSFSNQRWITNEELNSKEEITNKNGLGFHIAGMWDKVLDVQKCHLQTAPSNAIRNSVRALAFEMNIPFFNPRSQEGVLRTMMLRISNTSEIMVVIQMAADNVSQRNLFLDAILEKFPQITSLQYVINQKANDTIYDQEVICYHGRPYILEKMEGLQFKISAKSFYQTNSAQAYELYKLTRDFASLTGDELVYDLYTGTGTIAQFVAKKAKKVIGIESVPQAIEDAKANAKHNQIENTVFYCGDMKEVFTDAFIAVNGRPDVVITDPPRDGMHKKVVAQLIKISPKRIVYVSCNVATQARDLDLMRSCYRIKKTQSVDMFPQTHHVENVVLLERFSK